MIFLIISNTLGVWVLACPAIIIDTVVSCNHIAIAVVVAIVLYWQMLCLEFYGTCYCSNDVVIGLCRWKATHIGNNSCHLLNTCGHNTCYSGFPSAKTYYSIMIAITSAAKTKGITYANIKNMARTTTIAMCLPFTIVSMLIVGHTNMHTHKMLEIIKNSIILNLRKPCCKPSKSLSCTRKIFCLWKNLNPVQLTN